VSTDAKADRARPWASLIAFALVLVLAFALLRAVQTRLWGYWFGSTDLQETLPFALFLLGSFMVLSVGFVGGGVVRLTRTPWRALGWRREGAVKAIAWGLLGFVGTCVNVLVWNLVGGATSRPDYISPSAGRLLVVTFFAFGVAAWVEENLFRGYLQPLLARRLPLPVAITAQAAVFSVVHIGYTTSPIVFGSAFVSGVILGALRGRDRSLVAPYVAHGLLWMMALFGPAPT
jgi:membrane protease YdiL (CAAX protease family)